MTDRERFWSKVNKDGPIVRPELGPCWMWTAGRQSNGYGQFRLGTEQRAHRASWEFATGAAAGKKLVLHRCDNPPCVRPEHLFLGTNQDNMDDKVAKGRQARAGASLNEEQVLQLRELAARGATTKPLAVMFGISENSTRDVIQGKVWKNLLPATKDGAKFDIGRAARVLWEFGHDERPRYRQRITRALRRAYDAGRIAGLTRAEDIAHGAPAVDARSWITDAVAAERTRLQRKADR